MTPNFVYTGTAGYMLEKMMILSSTSLSSPPPYTEHAASFCTGNFDAINHTFYERAVPLSACLALAIENDAICFDHVDDGPKHLLCRITNYSAAVRSSGDGYNAYVASRAPPKPSVPPISASGIARYGCVAGVNGSTLQHCNTSLSANDRARSLISLLSPEEKGSLLTARTTKQSNAIPRLGVPLFCWGQNAAQGFLSASTAPGSKGGAVTYFPRAPGMAATWNLTLISEQGRVYSVEARSIFNEGHTRGSTFSCPGSIVLWGPTINLNRDPRWGRNGESSSEDPLFNALYGAYYADGAQRDPRSPRYLRSIVTLKHWGAYSVDVYKNATVEYHRQSFDANVSSFDMSDSYAPIFEGAVRGAALGSGSSSGAGGTPTSAWAPGTMEGYAHAPLSGATGVMCSYNAVNGIPACADRTMQTTLLRETWNFSGYVTGDSDTVQFINTGHHYENSPAGAVHAALNGGTDLESWTVGDDHGAFSDYYRDVIPLMLRNKSLDVALVDLALTRLLSLRIRAGLFDGMDAASTAFFKISPADRGTAEFSAISRNAARQSQTLLMNKGSVLPIPKDANIALIGPYRSYGDSAHKLDVALASLQNGAIHAVKGCEVSGHDTSGFAAAIAAVASCDIVVLALGCNPAIEHESADRLVVTLPSIQSSLALAVLKAAKKSTPPKPVVVLTINYGEISVEELIRPVDGGPGIDALIMSFWPNWWGDAIAEALVGAIDVSGKLPYTIYPNNYTDLIGFGDMSLTSGPGRGYRYYTGTPLFEFGHGLSYTRFELKLKRAALPDRKGGGLATFALTLSNLGSRAGSETVQLYYEPPVGLVWDAPLPQKKLIDWRKVHLEAGANVTLTFAVRPAQLLLVNRAGERAAAPKGSQFALLFSNGNDQLVTHAFAV